MALSSAFYHGSSSEITYMDAVLYKAAADGDINVLKSSLADFQVQLTPKKNTVLHIAAQFGRADCIDWILRQDSCFSLLLQPNLKGDTPLQLAAMGGHLKAVEDLIHAARSLPPETEGGPETDKAMLRTTNNAGDTALHVAVRFQHPRVVKLLIVEDASLATVANVCGETSLYIAAESGFRELVKIIIDNTRSSNIAPAHTGINRSTALHAAVIGNHKEIVKKMLLWKRDLAKEVDENGWSPLHCAACLGHTSIVKELLEKSEKSVVYLGVKDDDNKTALHIASSRGHVDIVKLLLSHSPDCCEQLDDKGNNALHFLKAERNLPLTFRWLNVRGLLNEKNDQGQTPVQQLLKDIFGAHANPLLLTSYFYRRLASTGEMIPFRAIWESAKARSSWQKIVEGDNCSRSESKERDEEISEIKKASEYHLIVAALIATVTFAAVLTMPGGYIQSGGLDDGMAVLATSITNFDFMMFIWEDAIALVSSMMAVTIYFLMALYNDKQILRKLFYYAYCLTLLSICTTVLAFLSCLLAVLQPSTIFGPSMTGVTFSFLLVVALILTLSPRPDNTLLFDQRRLFSPFLAGFTLTLIAIFFYA